MGVVAAIVIAGGGARRFGQDKLAIRDERGQSLLGVLLDDLRASDISPLVVVGPARDLGDDVVWTREHPEGGGPCAALVAGLACVPADVDTVIVLAGDAPGGARAVPALLAASAGAAGAVLVDPEGREQPISAVYDVHALREVLKPYGNADGLSVRSAVTDLRARGHVIARVADIWGAADDVDVPADAERLGFTSY